MQHHHARDPSKETVCGLPPMVPAERAIGNRQHACGNPECQALRRQKTQASWRRRNPGYATAYRIDQRAAENQSPEVLRLPAPLNRLPFQGTLPREPIRYAASCSMGTSS
jgi:hypothetical protein